MIISTTAYQSGKGTDRYKKVYGLTKDEKVAVKNGDFVVFKSQYKSMGRHGTRWRYVIPSKTGQEFYPRVVSVLDEVALNYIGGE